MTEFKITAEIAVTPEVSGVTVFYPVICPMNIKRKVTAIFLFFKSESSLH